MPSLSEALAERLPTSTGWGENAHFEDAPFLKRAESILRRFLKSRQDCHTSHTHSLGTLTGLSAGVRQSVAWL